MKTEIINEVKEIITNKKYHAEATTCGHLVDEWNAEAENHAEAMVEKATEEDVEKAFDECVKCGLAEYEVNAEHVLSAIGSTDLWKLGNHMENISVVVLPD